MDGRGAPLSIVVTGADRHDASQVGAVLAAAARPRRRRVQRLCADAGYRGRGPEGAMAAHGYAPHVRGRREEADKKRAHPSWRPRRRVVESTHGWFNRFRKLPVRFEKLARSYLALCHLAAAIIVFGKIRLPKNIIYG